MVALLAGERTDFAGFVSVLTQPSLLGSLIGKVRESTFHRVAKPQMINPPELVEPERFPYGPFRFKFALPKGVSWEIQTSTNLKDWRLLAADVACSPITEYVDSEASKFSYRLYRVVAGGVPSVNVLGYASTIVTPGYSMIANPFATGVQTVGELLKGWPNGTSLSRFDTRLFRMTENLVQRDQWTNPSERLKPGEGAIFFNPTSDYKSLSFCGVVEQGTLSTPIPAGFSIRSPLIPQPGLLREDLEFPVADGDVIHLFDRDQQQYVLYSFDQGKWQGGAPAINVCESFWVAKAAAANWKRYVAVSA